jgi:hypothetical protein
MTNIRLDGTITLLSPLSHIGESIGPDSYLSQDIIIGADNKPVEVFVYSGNAFRGILRDMAAIYMTERLGLIYTPDTFYLLFSGGSLGGNQSVDIDQARLYRKSIPMLSIFGGGIGNQILAGKIKVGSMYPIVCECMRVLPAFLRNDAIQSWKQWTFEKSFTRMDDAKNENRRQYLIDDQNKQLIEGVKAEKKKKDEQPQQMRYSIEMLAAGAKMYQRIDLCDMEDLELGAFVSAFTKFSKASYIGGKSATGHGLVEIEYVWRYSGQKEPQGTFFKVGNDSIFLSKTAEQAKDKYDEYLQRLYDNYLDGNAPELKHLLAGGNNAAT